MEKPPEGGERDNWKTGRKILGWLALQALSAWLCYWIEKLL